MRVDRMKLAAELVRKDLTQAELAKIAGVSRITISNVKNGKSCSDAVGFKIARALGVDVKEILEEV